MDQKDNLKGQTRYEDVTGFLCTKQIRHHWNGFDFSLLFIMDTHQTNKLIGQKNTQKDKAYNVSCMLHEKQLLGLYCLGKNYRGVR